MNESKKESSQILIPILILIFFPFPSKILGYSVALYISDIALLSYLLFISIKNRYKIPLNNTIYLMIGILFINIIGIIVGVLKGYAEIRQLTEIIRTFEWIIIYIYHYNLMNENQKTEAVFLKAIKVVILMLIPFTIIELFNLPGKDLLRNFYELSKSGNIFQYYNRISGPLRNPNFLGIFMTIILNFILISNYKLRTKVFFSIISIGLIYFTGSRTAIIIAVITISITYLINLKISKFKKERIKNIIAIIIILVISMVVVQENSNLFYSVRMNEIKDDIEDLNGRSQIWEKYEDDIQKNILIGNGIVKSNEIIFDNLYIQYMYYYGLIGISILACLFIRNIYKICKLYMLEKNMEQKKFIVAILAIQIIIIISGVTIQILDSLQIFYFYILAMAYIDTRYKHLINIKNKNIVNNLQKNQVKCIL